MKKILSTLILALISFQASAHWVSSSDIEKLCRKAITFDRDIPSCIMQFKDHRLSNIALDVCYKTTTFDKDLDECAIKLMDNRYSTMAPKACREITPFDNMQADCLYDLRNLDITSNNLKICLDSSNLGDKIKQCLLQISDHFNGDDDGPISYREIVVKIRRAIRMIDQNELRSAKNALRRLINDINDRQL